MTISQSQLKCLLDYNPDTGVFVWKKTNRKGCEAGCLDHEGYRKIQVNRKFYRAHRLTWLYVYGEFPKLCIDHINHKRDDNRICNLRDVSNKENQRNQSISSRNNSGVTGVSYYSKVNKWRARIWDGKKDIFLGEHKDKKEAIKIRKEYERKLGYHYNHGII